MAQGWPLGWSVLESGAFPGHSQTSKKKTVLRTAAFEDAVDLLPSFPDVSQRHLHERCERLSMLTRRTGDAHRRGAAGRTATAVASTGSCRARWPSPTRPSPWLQEAPVIHSRGLARKGGAALSSCGAVQGAASQIIPHWTKRWVSYLGSEGSCFSRRNAHASRLICAAQV